MSRAKPQRGRAPWDALPVSPARVRLGSHTVWPALHASWSPGAAPLQSGHHAGVLMVRAPLACARGPSTSHRGGLPHRRHSTVQCEDAAARRRNGRVKGDGGVRWPRGTRDGPWAHRTSRVEAIFGARELAGRRPRRPPGALRRAVCGRDGATGDLHTLSWGSLGCCGPVRSHRAARRVCRGAEARESRAPSAPHAA